MKTLTKTLLAGAALLLAAPALAQPGPGGHGGMMGGMMGEMMGERLLERFDANKDGAISKEEFAAARAANFKTMDPNGDGRITKDEVPEAMERMRAQREQERAERMFAELDANGDGAVTQEEFLSRGERMFTRMDRNDDGKLSPEDRRGR